MGRVLITGATRGIGRALFEAMQEAGEKVIGTYRDKPPTDLADKGTWLALDVAEPESHAAMARALEGRAIDLLICNARIYADKGHSLATGYPPDLWARMFAVNVTGVFQTIQGLLPNLQVSSSARIAILSSAMASDTRAPGGSYAYRASKAAALNLGRNLATDLRGIGISVGIYHPGWVKTEMGGSGAEIDAATAAAGLCDRFAQLGPDTTGIFETWDGQSIPF